MSSLTVLMISGVGWRWSFRIIGIIGVAAGIIGFIIIREPVRGAFDVVKKTEEQKRLDRA